MKCTRRVPGAQTRALRAHVQWGGGPELAVGKEESRAASVLARTGREIPATPLALPEVGIPSSLRPFPSQEGDGTRGRGQGS